jgi:hypothetical protein
MPAQERLHFPAVIQIECRDSIGHAFRNRDFCAAHAKPVIEKAERLKTRNARLANTRHCNATG